MRLEQNSPDMCQKLYKKNIQIILMF